MAKLKVSLLNGSQVIKAVVDHANLEMIGKITVDTIKSYIDSPNLPPMSSAWREERIRYGAVPIRTLRLTDSMYNSIGVVNKVLGQSITVGIKSGGIPQALTAHRGGVPGWYSPLSGKRINSPARPRPFMPGKNELVYKEVHANIIRWLNTKGFRLL